MNMNLAKCNRGQNEQAVIDELRRYTTRSNRNGAAPGIAVRNQRPR
jgi:hypothetical protein